MTKPSQLIARGLNVAATADTAFASFSVPDGYDSCAFRLKIALKTTAAILRSKASSVAYTTDAQALNAGTALAAGVMHTYAFSGMKKDEAGNPVTYTLECSAATTVDSFVLEAILDGGI